MTVNNFSDCGQFQIKCTISKSVIGDVRIKQKYLDVIMTQKILLEHQSILLILTQSKIFFFIYKT